MQVRQGLSRSSGSPECLAGEIDGWQSEQRRRASASPAEGGRRIYVTMAEDEGLLVGGDWAREKEDNSSRSSGGGKVSS